MFRIRAMNQPRPNCCSVTCSRNYRGHMVWTEAMIGDLRRLWPVMSATRIGAKLRISRDAVIGKAHRLDLPAKAARRGERAPA